MDEIDKTPCRLCLKYDRVKVNVFNNNNQNDLNIPCVVFELFSFWIKPSDPVSREICLDCITIIRSFYYFTLRVKESQKILSEYFSNKNENNHVKLECDDTELQNHKNEINVKLEELINNQCSLNLNETQLLKDPLNSNSFKYEISIQEDFKQTDRHGKQFNFDSNAEDHNLNQNSKETDYFDFDQTLNDDSNDSEQIPKDITAKEQIHVLENVPKEIFKHGDLMISKDALNELICNFYNIVCDICEDKPKFPKYLDLFEHHKIKHEMRGFLQCCDSKLIDRQGIVAHMVCHLQPDAFQCKICSSNFSSPRALYTHTQDVHTPLSQRQHLCDQCDKRFRTLGKLRTHKLLSHAPHSTVACQQCSKVYYSQVALKRHMKSRHSGKQCLCPVCGKTQSSLGNLNVHMSTHRAGPDEDVQCQDCGVIVKSQQRLRVHMRKQHSSVLLHCQLCEYSNKSSTALKRHMITRHSDDKPFVCDVCHKGFKFKTNLRHHSVQHTGEQKYACSFCPRTFAQSGNCYTHRMRMHPEQYKSLRMKKHPANDKSKKAAPDV